MRYDRVRKAKLRNRSGFTLVEILTVVGIIALLAAIAVPVAMRSINSAREFAVKSDVDAIADGVERYRAKFGEYPPDGSNAVVFERHLRQVFPQILDSEIALLSPSVAYPGAVQIRNDSDPAVIAGNVPARIMDPAEALIFFLGGFSSDPQRPFTGPGGPFALIPGSTTLYQYNPQRQNSMFDFDTGRMTIAVVPSTDVAGALITVSSDEGQFTGTPGDLLPTYLDKYSRRPLVYFDSRSYLLDASLVNRYGSVLFGTAVPYRSDEVNTLVTPAMNYFVNRTTFQVQSPGMDGRYNEFDPGSALASWPVATAVQIYVTGIPTKSGAQSFDNVANFCPKTKLGLEAQSKQTE